MIKDWVQGEEVGRGRDRISKKRRSGRFQKSFSVRGIGCEVKEIYFLIVLEKNRLYRVFHFYLKKLIKFFHVLFFFTFSNLIFILIYCHVHKHLSFTNFDNLRRKFQAEKNGDKKGQYKSYANGLALG